MYQPSFHERKREELHCPGTRMTRAVHARLIIGRELELRDTRVEARAHVLAVTHRTNQNVN